MVHCRITSVYPPLQVYNLWTATKAEQKKAQEEKTDAMVLQKAEQLKKKDLKLKASINLKEEDDDEPEPEPEIIIKKVKKVKAKAKVVYQEVDSDEAILRFEEFKKK